MNLLLRFLAKLSFIDVQQGYKYISVEFEHLFSITEVYLKQCQTSIRSFFKEIVKDAHKKTTSSQKTQVLTKKVNVKIWVIVA